MSTVVDAWEAAFDAPPTLFEECVKQLRSGHNTCLAVAQR